MGAGNAPEATYGAQRITQSGQKTSDKNTRQNKDVTIWPGGRPAAEAAEHALHAYADSVLHARIAAELRRKTGYRKVSARMPRRPAQHRTAGRGKIKRNKELRNRFGHARNRWSSAGAPANFHQIFVHLPRLRSADSALLAIDAGRSRGGNPGRRGANGCLLL